MNFFLALTLFDVTSYSDINYLLGGFPEHTYYGYPHDNGLLLNYTLSCRTTQLELSDLLGYIKIQFVMILHISYTSDVISNSSKQLHNIHYIIYTDVISTPIKTRLIWFAKYLWYVSVSEKYHYLILKSIKIHVWKDKNSTPSKTDSVNTVDDSTHHITQNKNCHRLVISNKYTCIKL